MDYVQDYGLGELNQSVTSGASELKTLTVECDRLISCEGIGGALNETNGAIISSGIKHLIHPASPGRDCT